MTHILGANEHHHVGHYLLGVGVMVALAKRYPTAAAYWDGGLHLSLSEDDVTAALLARATANDWSASTTRQQHPLFAQWGRREPHRWQDLARETLALMPARTREKELIGVLRDEAFRVHQTCSRWRGGIVTDSTRRAYGLGTIFPMTVPDATGTNIGWSISSWQAVLAWEAVAWIGRSASMRDYAWSAYADEPPWKAWHAVAWDKPVELRRVPLLWSPRGRLAGRAWSEWLSDPRADLLRPFGSIALLRHIFRQNVGSKTAEVYGGHFDANASLRLNTSIREHGLSEPKPMPLARRAALLNAIRAEDSTTWDSWTERPAWVRVWYLDQVGLPRKLANRPRMPIKVRRFLARRGVRLAA